MWIGARRAARVAGSQIDPGGNGLDAIIGFTLAQAHLAGRRLRALADERGQGTVEYVGLILLVSLLMVGMVAAMKGFNGKQGTELAEMIVDKIKRGGQQGHLQVGARGPGSLRPGGLRDWRHAGQPAAMTAPPPICGRSRSSPASCAPPTARR